MPTTLGFPGKSLIAIRIDGDALGFTWYTKKGYRKVAYPTAPPRNPPNARQLAARARFAAAAKEYAALAAVFKNGYKGAVQKLSLAMTPASLYISLYLRASYQQYVTLVNQYGKPLRRPSTINFHQ
jgi:hypothetical protein